MKTIAIVALVNAQEKWNADRGYLSGDLIESPWSKEKLLVCK